MKMHCLGNDFVVFDLLDGAPFPVQNIANQISDRRSGIGCDQVVEILPSNCASAKLIFYNADGSPSATCGNATRCVARYFMDQKNQSTISLETGAGILTCAKKGALTSVNMGQPTTDWKKIPLSKNLDILNLPLDGNPSAIGFGNPHCVFIVKNLESVEVETVGAEIEYCDLFPHRTNVEFVEILSPNQIIMKIWERGAGRTLASGSGASAAAAVTMIKSLVDKKVTVILDGGVLIAEWKSDGIWMTGPTVHVADGFLTNQFEDIAVGN